MNPLLHLPPPNPNHNISLYIHPNYLPFHHSSSNYTYQLHIPHGNYSSLPSSTNTNFYQYQPYQQQQPKIFNNYILQNSQFYITNYNHTHFTPKPKTNCIPTPYNINELSSIINESTNKQTEENKETIPTSTITTNKKLTKKRKRVTKMCTACPHKYAVHYAKNMCSNCYHVKGRSKKPWKCLHTNKSHYALGLCQNCYQMNYNRKQSETENISNKDELATNTGTSHTFS